jgi:hypothetical protein
MRRILTIILEQARQARERAWFYRKLSRSLGQTRSVDCLCKCARELEERAAAMEQYAAGKMADGKMADGDEPETTEKRNFASNMKRAARRVFSSRRSRLP